MLYAKEMAVRGLKTGLVAAFAILSMGYAASAMAETKVLNAASYPPATELYTEMNKGFIQHWKKTTGEDVTINQTYDTSPKQASAVVDGKPIDVVALSLATDVDYIADQGALPMNWAERLPHNSAPYTTTIVFLVRKTNPKNIQDWEDLARSDVKIVTPNPKTSGGARWNYLAVLGYGMKKHNNDKAKAGEFVSAVFKNVVDMDNSSRGATDKFLRRNVGDVLIAWENEAYLAVREFYGEFEIVFPSLSVVTEPAVAIIDRRVDANGTRKLAEGYVNYMYSVEGQTIGAMNFYRPRDEGVMARFKPIFRDMQMLDVNTHFGGWRQAQAEHFADGGTFDRLVRGGQLF